MRRAKINNRLIRCLDPGTSRYRITDTDIPGFCLRVNPSNVHTYEYRYRCGRQHRTFKIGTSSTLTPGQARKQAVKIAAEVQLGRDPAQEKAARRSVPSFGELAARYVREKQHEKRSIQDDISKINRFFRPLWGNRPIDRISKAEVSADFTRLHQKGLKPATINRYRALAVALFNWPIRRELLAVNPAAHLPLLQENNQREIYLSPRQIRALVEALSVQPPNSANAILMMLVTGQRRGDVLGMRWRDITPDLESWHIPLPKSGKAHRVFLGTEAKLLLQDQMTRRLEDAEYVFPGRCGKSRLSTVQQTWKRALARADLQGVRLHDLRHTYASEKLRNNVDIYQVKKILNHSSLKITERYAHITDSALKIAAEIPVLGSSISGPELGYE